MGLYASTSETYAALKKMFIAYDLNYGAGVAQEWGARYFEEIGCSQVFAEAARTDSIQFQSVGEDIELLATLRQSSLADDRMSISRVSAACDKALLAQTTGAGRSNVEVDCECFKNDCEILKVFHPTEFQYRWTRLSNRIVRLDLYQDHTVSLT